ncbi:hypothetical protein LLH03_00955 [bacterium]|nr:hypothetical protein [bacterium]
MMVRSARPLILLLLSLVLLPTPLLLADGTDSVSTVGQLPAPEGTAKSASDGAVPVTGAAQTPQAPAAGVEVLGPAQERTTVTVAGFPVEAVTSLRDGVTMGSGTVEVPEVGKVDLNFALDARKRVSGTWQGSVAIPGLSAAQASSGTISPSGLEGSRTLTLAGNEVKLGYVIRPGGMTADWTGAMNLGTFAFQRAAVRVRSVRSGGGFTHQATLEGSQALDLPGLGGAKAFQLSLEQGAPKAAWRGTIRLGSYAFNDAVISISSAGQVDVTGSYRLTAPGGVAIDFALAYDGQQLSAKGLAKATLGTNVMPEAPVTIGPGGEMSFAAKAPITLPGLGEREFGLTYEGAQVRGLWAGTVSLGTFSFPNTRILISTTGQVTVAGVATLSVPGITGARDFTLDYTKDQLTAFWQGTLALGTYNFPNTRGVISSDGVFSITGAANQAVPGVGGGRRFVLGYAKDTLSADWSGALNLGTYSFPKTSASITGFGQVSFTGKAGLTPVAALGAHEFDLRYAANTLRAVYDGTLSFSGHDLMDGHLEISSNGQVSGSGSASINIPVLGARTFALQLTNLQPSLVWSGSTNIAGLARDLTYTIAPDGKMRWRSSTGIKVGAWTLAEAKVDREVDPAAGIKFPLQVLGKPLNAVLDAAGNLNGSWSGKVEAFGIPLAEARLVADNTGVSGTGSIGFGVRQITGASFTVQPEGTLAGTGSVALGGGLSIGADFRIAKNSYSVTGTLAKDMMIPGVVANWHFTAGLSLGLANKDIITTVGGAVTRNPKHICTVGTCPNRTGGPLGPGRLGTQSCPADGKETGDKQTFGDATGSLDMANGEVKLHISAMYGVASQDLVFHLW